MLRGHILVTLSVSATSGRAAGTSRTVAPSAIEGNEIDTLKDSESLDSNPAAAAEAPPVTAASSRAAEALPAEEASQK